MGHPKKRKKSYERPRRPWVAERIKEEKELAEKYGLKNKSEVWKAESFVRGYRREVRKILAEIAGGTPTEHTMKKREEILAGLRRKGVLKEAVGEFGGVGGVGEFGEVETAGTSLGLGLEDVLAMGIEDILERRLQTRVFKKDLSNSIKQARQFIVHGHIAVNGARVTVPSYLVSMEEEREIGYYGNAPFSVSTASATSDSEEKGEVKEKKGGEREEK